jgi:hypothetical protein
MTRTMTLEELSQRVVKLEDQLSVIEASLKTSAVGEPIAIYSTRSITELDNNSEKHHEIELRKQRNASLIALLDEWRNEGDEAEQRETWEFLKQALDEDRPSYRKLFP